jgi:hypothetical protein
VADDAKPMSEMTKEELLARVAELEAEVDRKERALDRRARAESRGGQTPGYQVTDSMGELSRRSIDETNRLVRGLTLAHVEGFRAAADVLGAFADSIAKRNPPQDRNIMANLPSDMLYASMEAMNRAVGVPGRAMSRFSEAYREDDAVREREDERERDRDQRRR